MQPSMIYHLGGLKKAYQQEILDYNYYFRVLIPAYTKSMSEKAIKVGFENCGIYPVNLKATKMLRTWPSLIFDNYSLFYN